jgi:hypothetical protein
MRAARRKEQKKAAVVGEYGRRWGERLLWLRQPGGSAERHLVDAEMMNIRSITGADYSHTVEASDGLFAVRRKGG